MAVHLKENISFVLHLKGVQFFPMPFPKMLIIFPIHRAPGPCPKKGCDRMTALIPCIMDNSDYSPWSSYTS